MAAQVAMYALHEMGQRVPAQVLVAGFDDINNAINIWPGLTVHNPLDEIVDQALMSVRAILDGKLCERQQVVVTPHLVMRGSPSAPGRAS